MVPLLDQRALLRHRTPEIGPAMNISALKQLDRELPVRGFGIKYVLRGVERYTVNGQPMPIAEDCYLLVNRTSPCRVTIDSARPVLGFCVELTGELMDDVAQAWLQPDAIAEKGRAGFFMSEEFPEGRHSAQGTRLGPVLKALAHELFAAPEQLRNAPRDIFYRMAELIVQDHQPYMAQLRSLAAARLSTRKAIRIRVAHAKAYIDACYGQPLQVVDMAREAAMSEYHFYRAFRAVHGVSPHRYLQHRRLAAAREILVTGKGTVLDAALLCGFADAPTFSKAFRKAYGHPPSEVLRRTSRI